MRFYRTAFKMIPVFSLFLAGFLFPVGAETAQPVNLSGPRIEVLDLRADYHADNTLVVVSGKIRNLNHEILRGHVNIYLLDHSGSVITAYENPVNQTRSFAHGQIASFEAVINVADIRGINNVSVEFVRQ